jgi:hypothetical protein
MAMADQIDPTGAAPWRETEEEMGFKKLTLENWVKPDSVTRRPTP